MKTRLEMRSLILKRIPIDTTKMGNTEDEQSFFHWEKGLVNFLKSSPNMINWKNTDSEFLGCTTKISQLANLKSSDDIIGKNDDDMPWGKNGFAEIFRTEDKEALKGKTLYILGKYQFGCRELMVLVKKMPILKDSEIIGTINFISEFNHPSIKAIISQLMELDIVITPELLNEIKSTFLDKTIALSPREEECAFYLFKGLSAKEIAQKLKISNRTVEFYLNALKEKFQVKKTASLIVKMLESGYMDNVPTHLLLNEAIKEAC